METGLIFAREVGFHEIMQKVIQVLSIMLSNKERREIQSSGISFMAYHLEIFFFFLVEKLAVFKNCIVYVPYYLNRCDMILSYLISIY